jgi:ketosteroid isomerase-like protein
MSQENVDAYRRAVDAGNRGDIEPMLELSDPEVEWYPAMPLALRGEPSVLRGHEAIRKFSREETEFGEYRYEYTDIRDLGDRIVAIGTLRARGKHSRVATESPVAYVVDIENGKIIRVRGYFDPQEALAAAGLRE